MTLIKNPSKIEAKSFEIIDRFLKTRGFPGQQKDVVRRVIHASADLQYARDLVFSRNAIPAGLSAIRNGKAIVVDSSMVKAGVNKNITSEFANKIICPINDEDVIKKARSLSITRAIAAMRKARRMMNGGIVAIGNAPTALQEVCGLIEQCKAHPALVVGIPVGFVGAVESKQRLRGLGISFITNKSRKGGSAIAAAIVNALLILAREKRARKEAANG